ncbi:beta-4C adrenergic receptor-like [Asterias amurensis]|uniref:beta-4C adrenergic receptor-like n=1 Tax=Asterias amurensis TaxID=7602 RepID=UPI003AB4F768
MMTDAASEGVDYEDATLSATAAGYTFEDKTQRTIIGCAYCLVALTGFVGNVLVILAVILSKKLQTRTNAFVVNLATADMVTCTAAPFMAVALLSMDGWPLPDVMCSLAGAFYYTALSCSIMNLAAIAINRYILITKSMETYRAIYTKPKMAAMLVFTWLYPALVCCIPLFGVGRWGYSEKFKTCSQDSSITSSRTFSLLGSTLIYPVPLIILFVCYFKIYRHISSHLKKIKANKIEMADTSSSNMNTMQRQRKPPMGHSKRQIKITKNLFYAMCAFIICLLPFAIALVIRNSDPVVPWTGMIVLCNSAVNPVIYGVKHPHFRVVFRCMLRCRCYMIPEPSRCLRKVISK